MGLFDFPKFFLSLDGFDLRLLAILITFDSCFNRKYFLVGESFRKGGRRNARLMTKE